MKKIQKALISISDKEKLKPLLNILSKFKIKIISSGGTFKEIKKLKFKCTEVSDYTGFQEILDGRVKTLHPKIHAGILSKRKNKNHKNQLKKNNFEEIDLVIVNFYPFEKVLEANKSHSKIIENIDIGGPTMVRAAAKNYSDVTVITSSNQYEELINNLRINNGSTSLTFRQKMSEEAFTETSYYDALISNYFNKLSKNFFPKKKIIQANLIEKLRYGENPHQQGALYSTKNDLGLKQMHGKILSYNNYNDIFAALNITKSLPKNSGTVIVKHANPSGVSVDRDHLKSFELALACDPVSAFGGVVSCNYRVNKKIALKLSSIFFEVIIAIGFDLDAIKILKKKKNLRIINSDKLILQKNENFISKFNSLLVQSSDTNVFKEKDFKVVSKIKPTHSQLKKLILAFNIARFVQSNAIVLTNNLSTVGIGSGQPSRLDSCQIAIDKMKKFQNLENKEILAASDAFFPFTDGIEKLVQAGISAVIQPSGSIRDKEIIKFANETKTILVFSNTRHFKH